MSIKNDDEKDRRASTGVVKVVSPDCRLAQVILDLSESFTKTQGDTLAALQELNASVKNMSSSSQQQEQLLLQQAQPFLRTRSVSFDDDDEYYKNEEESEEESEEEEAAADPSDTMERTTIRLDGLEVYAVVAALTSATSIACFDTFDCQDWVALVNEWRVVELIGDFMFLVSSGTGIVAGLHATLVFSLMTMYGRTAVGMDRDDAFVIFFSKTGMQRYRGFQSFLYSLYAFLVQVVIMITSKCPAETRVIAFFVILFSMHLVYKDTQSIIASAGVIFMAPVAKVEESKKDD
jgi:hypothetical protein